MPRTKTHITIAHIEDIRKVAQHELTPAFIVDTNEATQADALKWVKEHGDESVEYTFFRAVRTVTKKIKKTVVLVDG